jgi:hypothetical protein
LFLFLSTIFLLPTGRNCSHLSCIHLPMILLVITLPLGHLGCRAAILWRVAYCYTIDFWVVCWV